MNNHQANATLLTKKFYFISDLEILERVDNCALLGRSRSTLRRWWMAGKFPKPFKLNAKIQKAK
jgi:hypothetical protein